MEQSRKLAELLRGLDVDVTLETSRLSFQRWVEGLEPTSDRPQICERRLRDPARRGRIRTTRSVNSSGSPGLPWNGVLVPRPPLSGCHELHSMQFVTVSVMIV